MTEDELRYLLNRSKDDVKKKAEILLLEPTYFAKVTERKDAYNFWLAGDINDARRVDTGIEGLSGEPLGVEQYYIRIAIEVEKPNH